MPKPDSGDPLPRVPGSSDRLLHRIWRSIFRGPLRPRTDQERKWVMVQTFILHFRPVRVPARTLAYTHTFGLGGMSLLLVLLLIGTGALLMFGYEPSPERAHASVQALETDTVFGGFVRGVHHWSANALILIVLLHLLRVFLTSAFHPPRQFNWVLGLLLLAGVAASNFTGYLLPWDQRSYWAITITTGMLSYIPLVGASLQEVARGGSGIGQATLMLFYTLHTTVVPVLILVLAALHFWRVRKAKGVVVPRAPGETVDPQPAKVLGLPFLLLREFVVGLLLVAAITLLAAVAAAPLGEVANPGMSPNPAKAPWYFMGLQELLLHLHPLAAVVILPALAAVMLFLLPYVRYDDDPSGVWFVSARGRRIARNAAVGALVATPILVLLDEWLPDVATVAPGVPPVLSGGLLPLVVLAGCAWAVWRTLRVRHGLSKSELVLGTFVLAVTGFAVLTVVGVWFRTEGMALGWAG